MPIGDIRSYKMHLREQYRAIRTALTPDEKAALDAAVAARVFDLWQYRTCRQVLVYVSTAIEVDTRAIINRALADGKAVAVPRCVPGTRDMEFYYIRSLDELSPGTFGVDEPTPVEETRVTDLSHGLCLMPGFCYDFEGFRLGYGKGYYDRFLPRFGGNRVGICYSSCIRHHLPHGRYDTPAELIVTDKFIRRTKR